MKKLAKLLLLALIACITTPQGSEAMSMERVREILRKKGLLEEKPKVIKEEEVEDYTKAGLHKYWMKQLDKLDKDNFDEKIPKYTAIIKKNGIRHSGLPLHHRTVRDTFKIVERAEELVKTDKNKANFKAFLEAIHENDKQPTNTRGVTTDDGLPLEDGVRYQRARALYYGKESRRIEDSEMLKDWYEEYGVVKVKKETKVEEKAREKIARMVAKDVDKMVKEQTKKLSKDNFDSVVSKMTVVFEEKRFDKKYDSDAFKFIEKADKLSKTTEQKKKMTSLMKVVQDGRLHEKPFKKDNFRKLKYLYVKHGAATDEYEEDGIFNYDVADQTIAIDSRHKKARMDDESPHAGLINSFLRNVRKKLRAKDLTKDEWKSRAAAFHYTISEHGIAHRYKIGTQRTVSTTRNAIEQLDKSNNWEDDKDVKKLMQANIKAVKENTKDPRAGMKGQSLSKSLRGRKLETFKKISQKYR